MKLITLVLVCMLSVVSCQDVINNYCYGSPTPPKDDEFVAFSVASKKAFAPKTSSRVPMETIIYNAGGYFWSSDNAFHAPFKGVYFFTFSVVAMHNKYADMEIMTQKAGVTTLVPVARAIDRGVEGPAGSTGASVIVQLEAGEIVFLWFYTQDASGYGIRLSESAFAPNTMFTGKLEKKL